MPINLYTMFWAAVGILSLIGLYMFNSKPSFLNFITKREYLVAFLIAAVFGMRETFPVACIIMGVTLVAMFRQYPQYLKTCFMHKQQEHHGQGHNYQHRKS